MNGGSARPAPGAPAAGATEPKAAGVTGPPGAGANGLRALGAARIGGRPPLSTGLGPWARIAAQSFGGPAGQIAVIHRVAVVEKGWLDEPSFARALGYCMLLPGPEAQQLATYVGWRTHGTSGGLVAGGLFILPGFLSILALSVAYASFGDAAAIESLFYGLKAAVLAVVVQALLRMRGRMLGEPWTVAVAALSFLGLFAFDVPFPALIAGAAVVGLASGWRGRAVEPPAVVDSARPPRVADPSSLGHADPRPPVDPSSTRGIRVGRRARPLRTALTWLALWLLPVAGLAVILPPDHVLVREAVFFSKAAVVTFGGAYAVLAYVAQQAVDVYAWLAPGEMLDGLGMAETTPGPLIQVVQFVGFMGAYRNAGSIDPLRMGVAGSLVTTWVTFAPCFLFVLAGAPFIEELARRPGLQRALSGITAGVVGAVLNLAAWFSIHTLFGATTAWTAGPLRLPWPVWSTLDLGAAAIAAAAMLLALRYRAGMFAILGVGVAAGAVLRLLA